MDDQLFLSVVVDRSLTGDCCCSGGGGTVDPNVGCGVVIVVVVVVAATVDIVVESIPFTFFFWYMYLDLGGPDEFSTLFPFQPLDHTPAGDGGGGCCCCDATSFCAAVVSILLLNELISVANGLEIFISLDVDVGIAAAVEDEVEESVVVAAASLLSFGGRITTGVVGGTLFITNCSVSYVFAVFNCRND